MSSPQMNTMYGTKWFTFYTKVRPLLACFSFFSVLSDFIKHTDIYMNNSLFVLMLISVLGQAILCIAIFIKSNGDYPSLVRFIKSALLYEIFAFSYQFSINRLAHSAFPNLSYALISFALCLIISYFVWYRLNMKYFKKRILFPYETSAESNINQSVYETPKILYCRKCGEKLIGENSTCNNCGVKFKDGIRVNKYTVTIAVLVILLIIVSSICVLQYISTFENQDSIDRLQAEITELREETTSLENEVNSLEQLVESKQYTISYQKEIIDGLEESLYFFDEHAEIVPDDGTNTYHKYWCSQLGDFESFWIYNTENAEYNGYSACPDCH